MNFASNILHRNPAVLLVRYHSRSSADYCLDLVKKHDYENFISAILLKNKARSTAIAVRSFNVEVSKVAEQVTQVNIGLMRMKFWEEAIKSCYEGNASNVPQHPVITELFKAVNGSKLSKRYLNNLVESRKSHFNITAFSSLENMEKFAEQSVSSVYYLILEGCDVRNVHADHAASHLGKAQGIVQQLKTIQYAKQINFIPIPQEILIKNSLSQEDILRCKPTKALSDCVYDIASRAHQHLVKARKLGEDIPKEARSALLPSIAIHSYLERLQKLDYDVLHPSLKHRSWDLLPQLWWSNFRNKY